MFERLTVIPLLQSPPSERDWLDSLLQPLRPCWLPFADHAPIIENGLYVYNSTAPLQLSPEFLASLRRTNGCGLLHLGDEYFRGDYKTYRHFDYVIRMYPIEKLETRGVACIPVGYTANLGQVDIKPASKRQHLSFFAGDWKADRGTFARHFESLDRGVISLPKSFLGQKRISRDAFLEGMADTVFAPCPAGNVGLETSRPYEALEYGAIPILPSRAFADKYKAILGDHPLPTFSSWRKARRFVEKMSADPEALDALQEECLAWWARKKANVSETLIEHIRQGQQGAFRSDLDTFGHDARIGRLNRTMELLRQQNKIQLFGRASFLARTGLHLVLKRRRLQGVWSYEPPQPKAEDDLPERKVVGLD